MKTVELFNELAPDYWLADYISFGLTDAVRKKSIQLLEIKENETVCDAMCGTGNNFKLLAEKKCNTIAIDNAAEMLEIAHQQTQSSQYKLINENFLHTTIAGQSIDKLICTFGIKSLNENEYDLFIQQIYHVLKPKGTFVLADILLNKKSISGFFVLLYVRFVLPLVNKICTGKNPHKYLYHFIKKPFNAEALYHSLEKMKISYQVNRNEIKQSIIIIGRKE